MRKNSCMMAIKMQRAVIPEYLDKLPHDHGEAIASRRALRFFNWFLNTDSWFKGEILARLQEGESLLEVGAGEGRLSGTLFEAVRKKGLKASVWTLLDAQPVFSRRREAFNYTVEDLLLFRGYDDASLIFGNMILHHFSSRELERLGEAFNRHARLLVFQEPARRKLTYGLCRLFSLPLGRVTRHDAPVSIRAGFRGEELPEWLGLKAGAWDWNIQCTLRGAYRMTAWRR